jgi:Tol biopolymer transport system component
MFKSFNKGISSPIAILIIGLVIVIIGGGILAWQRGWIGKELTPKAQPTPTTTPAVTNLNLTTTKLATLPVEVEYIPYLVGGPPPQKDIYIFGPYITFSPDGQKVAFIVHNEKEGKEFVMINGEKEESYDKIDNLIFNSNGEQLVYTAREGNQEFVVVNGEKIDSYDVNNLIPNSIIFSLDGKQLAYTGCKGGKYFLVINGVEIESRDIVDQYGGSPIWGLTFSSNGQMLAYIIEENGGCYSGKSIVIVRESNGEKKEYDFNTPCINYSSLIFSSNNQRFAYGAYNGKHAVIVDGIESKSYNYISSFVFSPDSKKVAYSANKGGSGFNKYAVLVVDNEEKEMKNYLDISNLIFSPDSQQLAFIANTKEGYRVVINSQEGKTYGRIEKFIFSPDSKKLAYIAWDGWEGGKKRIVIDNKEQEAFYDVLSDPTFSPDSKNLAYIVEGDKSFVMLNDKKGPLYDEIWNLSFSPDGKYITYGAKLGNELWWIAEKVEEFGIEQEETVSQKDLIQNFYKAIEDRNEKLLISYFTPPVTEKEKERYDWLTGADLPNHPYRVLLRTKISNPSIKYIENIEEGKFKVTVIDEFQSWDNSTAKWSDPASRNIYFILVQKGDKWLIDKYIWDDYNKVFYTEKYSGFGQEEIITDFADWKNYYINYEPFYSSIKYPLIYEKDPKYENCIPYIVKEENKPPLIFIGPLVFSFESADGLTLEVYVDRKVAKLKPDPKEGIFVSELLSRENILLGSYTVKREAIKIHGRIVAASEYLPYDIYTKMGDKILHINYDDGILTECTLNSDQKPSDMAELMLSTFGFSEE